MIEIGNNLEKLFTRKGHEGIFWSTENTLYFDLSGGYTNISMYKNVSGCTLKIGALYHIILCVSYLIKKGKLENLKK